MLYEYTCPTYFFVFLFFFFILSGCNDSSLKKDDYSKYLNQHINIDMFSTVIHRDSIYSWANFRKKYPNLSVVYLEDGCSPCYPRFIEWHSRMEQVSTANDYTVLFVINARNFEDFLKNVRVYCENRYYYVMDPGKMFLQANGQIPIWIIMEQSILIDERNQVKMLGAPFANADMTKVFHIVTGVESRKSGESPQ